MYYPAWTWGFKALNIQMDTPSQVGSDRIVIAVAALAEYEPPLILLDLGTATFRIAFYRSIICKNRGVVKAFCSFDRGYSAP